MLLFKERTKLSDDFYAWCRANREHPDFKSMLLWLGTEGFLNERNIRLYLGIVVECPKCGGNLSSIRESKGRQYRHCYSCHCEIPVDDIDASCEAHGDA